VMLTAARLIGPGPRTLANFKPPSTPQMPDGALRFLLLFTIGPIALCIIAIVGLQTGFHILWFSCMFNLFGLLAIALAPRWNGARSLVPITIIASVLIIVVPLAYSLMIAVHLRGHFIHLVELIRGSDKLMRVKWPQVGIADRMNTIWTQRTGRPLGI